MVYGYCRVSTAKQNLERQLKNILAYDPTAKIYTEKFSGKVSARPEYQKLIKKVTDGDTIIFDSVSRMSRNAEEGIATYFDLMNRGVELIFLNEPYINTSVYHKATNEQIALVGDEIADIYITATNQVLETLAKRQIQIAFDQADKEGKDISKRVSEGMKANHSGDKISDTKTGTTYTTKKAADCMDKIWKLSKDFGGTMADTEIIELLQITRKTYYKYKRQMKEQIADTVLAHIDIK